MVKIIILILMLGVSGWSETEQYKLKPNEVKVKIEKPRNKIIEGKDDIKFFDGEGRVTKKIELLDWNTKKVTLERKNHPRLKKVGLVKAGLTRKAVISKNEKYVAVIESLNESSPPETEESKKALETVEMKEIPLGTIDTIKYFDNRGELLWEKKAPRNVAIEDVKISDDGKIAAFIQIYTIGGLDEEASYKPLLVYNKDGQILLSFPEKKGEYGIEGNNIYMSPNGRYLCVGASTAKREPTVIFFDLVNNTSWVASSQYSPYKIENDGIAHTSYYDRSEKKIKSEVVDLKNFLGK